jgi:hypothetical protein
MNDTIIDPIVVKPDTEIFNGRLYFEVSLSRRNGFLGIKEGVGYTCGCGQKGYQYVNSDNGNRSIECDGCRVEHNVPTKSSLLLKRLRRYSHSLTSRIPYLDAIFTHRQFE